MESSGTPRKFLADEDKLLRAGYLFWPGAGLRKPDLWERSDARLLKKPDYQRLLSCLLHAASKAGLVAQVATPFGTSLGWQLKNACIEFHAGEGKAARGGMDNAFYRALYLSLSQAIASDTTISALKPVSTPPRWTRTGARPAEMRFRYGAEDKKRLTENAKLLAELGEQQRFLPVLFTLPPWSLAWLSPR